MNLRAAFSRPILVVATLAAAYAAMFVAQCVVKHRFYLYDDFDLAIFTQATDQLLRGSFFVSIRGMNWLGDHTSLILFAIAPIYALFRDAQTLLVIQTLALSAGAFPVYWIARRELANDRAAIGCAALYLLYPALGFLNLFEFHPESIATPALLFLFHFTLAGRLVPALVAATVALACREDVPLAVVPMGLWSWWIARRRPTSHPPGWIWAAALAALGAMSLVLSFVVIKPRFNVGEVSYFDMYAHWGPNAGEAIGAMLRQPLAVIGQLFTTPGNATDTGVKLQFHLFMLAPLAFLPLASPATLVLALPVLAEHLLSNREPQHQIVYQYTALLIPTYVVAGILGLRNLVRLAQRKRRGRGPARTAVAPAMLGVWVALGAATVSNVAFGSVLGGGRIAAAALPERTWPNLTDRAQRPYRDRMMAMVPSRGVVVAGFEFLSRFAGHADVHSLHHLFRGSYAYSSRAYPLPDSVVAVIADFASGGLRDYRGKGKTARMQYLISKNRLAPADAAGDLVLFLSDSPRKLPLLSVGELQNPGRPVRLDEHLEFAGSAVADPVVAAGALLEIATYWRRAGPIHGYYMTAFVLLDARGRPVHRHLRHLGYTCFPPETWPENATVQERYRFAVPSDLPPGRHYLCLDVVWVEAANPGDSEPDHPTLRPRGNLIGLAAIEVTQS